MILHCFSEIDIETEQLLNRLLYQKLFRQCEEIGFFCEQIETELIRFTGPFNVRDELQDVSFNILWTVSRKQIKEAWFSWRDTPNGELKKHYVYHFLTESSEVTVMEDFAFA